MPTSDPNAEREIVSTRVYAVPREAVFGAFADPVRLAQWWGPSGFTSTTHEFDLRPGGRWRFTMHGPDGADYPNEKEFIEVVPNERIVFQHHQAGHGFRMTMVLAAHGAGTELTWRMRFESAAEFARVKGFIAVANEQNLDRLAAHLSARSEGIGLMSANKTNPSDSAAEAADREIVFSRVVNAPRELVWRAFTEPGHVVHWWGPRGFTTTIKKMDFRIGGVWEHVMRGPDGTNYPNKSVFKDIVPLEKIVYSHGGGREDGRGASFAATWTFEEAGAGQTRLTSRMVFPTVEARDRVVRDYGAIEGGKQTLERLSEYLPAMPK